MTITKVLIANRGEIAVRIIRAAADAGITSVAIYADPDADALFVQRADEAYALGGSAPADSYLNIDKVLAAATASGADAIHPGYGFLAENATFAEAVIAAGLTWIGPPPAAISALGDKVSARTIAERVGAPLVVGTEGPVADAAAAVAFADQHGLPIAIKAAYGGGGRGLKVARERAEIADLFASATREATNAFGRGECFVERYLERPRHVETQCLADSHGNVVVVSTRDCSLQRRYQKLVEEAPAPFLTDDQTTTLIQSSKAILSAAGYIGAGTCEFLIGADGAITFLEVNTRLQVEHPVSEEVTGIDLVREMFRIAEGEELGYDDPVPVGHSIEFRINAEDPASNFLPAPGRLVDWQPPGGPGVRVDEGYRASMTVPSSFDSLIAKVIVTGADRPEALSRARRALSELVVDGMPTVLGFHQSVLDEPAFTAPDGHFAVHTRWIETEWHHQLSPWSRSTTSHVGAAGAAHAAGATDAQGADSQRAEAQRTVTVEVNGKRMVVRLPAELSGASGTASTTPRRPTRHQGPAGPANGGAETLISPMQGTVVSVAAADGDQVSQGDPILVIEAMKMEQSVTAHRTGVVRGLTARPGDSIGSAVVICSIDEADTQR